MKCLKGNIYKQMQMEKRNFVESEEENEKDIDKNYKYFGQSFLKVLEI